MKISELIKKLQYIQKEKGDVEVLAMSCACVGEFTSLDEGGINYDRFNKSKNVLYIGW